MEVVTERKPTEAEWEDLLFAWRVSKHVKSNAIVLARDLATVGIGAGPDEPRRLASAWRSRRRAPSTVADGRGAGLRRVLPVRRRARSWRSTRA